MTTPLRAALILVAMLGVGFAAFGLPRLLYPDYAPAVLPGGCAQSCVPRAIRHLKAQAAAGYKIRPEFSQVTSAYVLGDTPYHVQGTVVWRTLFGLPVAEAHVFGAGKNPELNLLNWALAWATFALVEGVLSTLLLKSLLA